MQLGFFRKLPYFTEVGPKLDVCTKWPTGLLDCGTIPYAIDNRLLLYIQGTISDMRMVIIC